MSDNEDVSPDEREDRITQLEKTAAKLVIQQGELALVIAHMRREIARGRIGSQGVPSVVGILREEEITRILNGAVEWAASVEVNP